MMTEDASHLARAAKSLQQTLKESLKIKDPWDKETDFTRKQLRRHCLRLLLLHPYAPESKDAENQLWMQTSYAFIAVYKQRIATLDRATHSSPRQHQQPAQGQGQEGQGQGRGRGHGGHGVVEYRKLLQRFRQFLSDEEKFWVQLIVRIRRIFALDDAQHILAELGLIPDDTSPPPESGPPKRNHFQFPSESEVAAVAPSLTPTTRDQRESRMAILSKALVCLGDIERYKEQYNEAGGRPRAGHEDGPPAVGASGNQKGGRGKKGGGGAANTNGNGTQGPVMPRMRNYDKAQQCYQQARILLPQDGNPAHQMAILASYQKDVFASLVHYYRALCVRSPYDTAAENLGTVLTKTLDQWKARGAKRDREREKEQARGEAPPMAPRLRVESFKEKLIVLHALWRISPEEAEAISPNLANRLAEDFRSLISERVLPLDIVLKTVILAQGALWKHRVFRTAPTNGHKKGPSPTTSSAVESSIAAHLLMMHRVLLEVGAVQIAEVPPEDAVEQDLAQHITAAFRRTLPALRIASKWLRANLRYVGQSTQPDSEASSSRSKGRDRRRGSDRRSASISLLLTIPGLPEFWRAYAQFSTALHRAFPPDKLPKLVTTLEEDVEMAGFSPLKKFVPGEVVGAAANKESAKSARNGSADGVLQAVPPEQVHPNEEQLMRIADLLVDAQGLVKDEGSPLTFADGKFVVKGLPERTASAVPIRPPPSKPVPRPYSKSSIPKPTSPPLAPRITHEPRPVETDDDNMTDITRTEDDPVEQAFRTVLSASTGVEDDDEEDEIVWNPGVSPSSRDLAVLAGVPATLAASPPHSFVASPPAPVTNLSPRSPKSFSPRCAVKKQYESAVSVAPPAVATTAKDILSSVLHRSPPRPDLVRSLHMRQASAPQSTPLLFGSTPLGGTSIWSSNEGTGGNFHGAAGTTNGPLYQSYYSHSQLPNPSSTIPPQAQASMGLGHPSVPLGPAYQLNSAFSGGHQRVQSLSATRSSQPYSSQSQSQSHSHSQSHSQSQIADPFNPCPALTEQGPVAYDTGVPGAYADPIYSRKLDPTYSRQEAPGVGLHDRTISYHLGHREPGYASAFPPPLSSMAQIWNNAG